MRQTNVTDLHPQKQAKISTVEMEAAIASVMARSGKSRDVAVLALGIAAKRMAEGRK